MLACRATLRLRRAVRAFSTVVYRGPSGFEVLATDADTASHFDVIDPASLKSIASVPDMGEFDAQKAIQDCKSAQVEWGSKTAAERGEIIERVYTLMHKYKDDLAHIITVEGGKPFAESIGEVGYAASFFKFYAEEGKRAYGEVIPTNVGSKRYFTMKQPVGVTACVTPWNFPSAMITRKLAPALAAGCGMIIKPAEDTPLSALAVQTIAAEAGVPDGVIRTLTCSRDRTQSVGSAICESFDVRKFSFTGSTMVGKLLAAQCTQTVKRVSLELGGNAPFIVFEDADLDAAVVGALASKFRNSGQTCVCANRLLVHSKVYDEFASRLEKAVNALKVGHGLDQGITQGPLINRKGLEKALEHVSAAVGAGATAITGGAEIEDLPGHFLQPTILTDVTHSMVFTNEETFGPVAPLIRFNEEEEAIKWANETTSGLAAYVYTKDVNRCFRVTEALQYGMVGVNEGILSSEVAPFGGIKESGIGREGGREGLLEYMNTKYMCLGGF